MQPVRQLSQRQVNANRRRAAVCEQGGVPDIDLSDAAFDGILALLDDIGADPWRVYRTDVSAEALDELVRHKLITCEQGRFGWNVDRPMYTERYAFTWLGKDYLWWWGVRGC